MPYKEELKNPSLRPRKKPQYKVVNWTEHNKSPKKRGELSLYFPRGDLKSQFINESPYVEGISGQQETYKKPYIELIYMFYICYGWLMVERRKGFLFGKKFKSRIQKIFVGKIFNSF